VMFDRERCWCCLRYVLRLSERWWCAICEREFVDVMTKAREILNKMGATR
jgi:hypothetical protein